MAIKDRTELFKEIEAARKRPLIAYVTSSRPNAVGQIAGDVIPEILRQLERLPTGTSELDLFLASSGGDGTVAWRLVSLIRERVKRFAVLIPQEAFSAATLISLGADEILMHPNGNLGPVDPQITVNRPQTKDGLGGSTRFGSEDLTAFISFARENVGLSDQAQLVRVFEKFCDEVGAVPIGVAARSAQLSMALGEKLLTMHMGGGKQQQARVIAEKLNKHYFHHGYALSRKEAKEIGLPVVEPSTAIEELICRLWSDFEDELELRKQFIPLEHLQANPACAPLFAPVPQFQLPQGLPAQVQQQLIAQAASQITAAAVPATNVRLVWALVESSRSASRFEVDGMIFATRGADLKIRAELAQTKAGWTDVPLTGATGVEPKSSMRIDVEESVRGSVEKERESTP